VLFTFGFRAAPWWMTATLVLTLLGALAWFVLPLSFKMFTDGAIAGSTARVWTAAVLVAALSSLRWCSVGLTATIGGGLTERVNFYMSQRIGRLTTSVEGIEHFERPEYLQELDLLNTNRALLASGPRQVLLVSQLVIQLVAVGGLLASISPVLALLPVLGLVPFTTEGRSVRVRQRMEERMVEQRRLANRLFELTSTAAPAKELRVYGLAGELQRRHDALAEEISRATAKAALEGALLSFAGWTVFAAGMVGGIALVVFRAVDGRATPGEVLMATALAQQIRFQLSQVADAIGQTLTMAKTAHRFLWLEDYAHEAAARVTPGTEEPPTHVRTGISLDGVAFTYPGTDAPVLEDVNLTLPAGASIAVVGENGAGKTTLVKLLTRMYRPTEGIITVDGVNLDDIDTEAWRARVASTFQDFVRYELMAGGTVGVGDVPRYDDVNAITTALDRAAATEVVATLPDGLETKLGRSFKGGQELSGGQWQKLALGRGMMRDTPLLVVLDEPTASLDAMTEHALFERYADAARRLGGVTGAVTILVSHRFSTVRMADLIVVVDGGRIVERGSHAQLMAVGGLYAELFNLQAAAYK
jgi:ATP-binding cassette subfamily B protein